MAVLYDQPAVLFYDPVKFPEHYGVAIGSFYTYFEDKHELMMTIFQEYHGRIKEVIKVITIDEYLKKGDVKGFVEHLIEKLMEAHNVSPKLHQEIEAMKHSDEDIKK